MSESIDSYITSFSGLHRERLEELRDILVKALPEAQEKISYSMPALFWKQNLVYYGASKNHIGLYPTSSGVEAFKDQLTGLTFTKGAIQFPLDKPLPQDLIVKIALFRRDEVAKKKSGKE